MKDSGSDYIISVNALNFNDILSIHRSCDQDFVTVLSARVNLEEYARKLFDRAETISVKKENILVAMLGIYCNDFETKCGYISTVCVVKEYRGMGLSDKLLEYAINHAEQKGMNKIRLEVGKNNTVARNLYMKFGFTEEIQKDETIIMILPKSK